MKSGREDPRLCAVFALDGDDAAAGERAAAIDTEDLRQMVIGNVDVGGRENAECDEDHAGRAYRIVAEAAPQPLRNDRA